jgi:hypothetical protein
LRPMLASCSADTASPAGRVCCRTHVRTRLRNARFRATRVGLPAIYKPKLSIEQGEIRSAGDLISLPNHPRSVIQMRKAKAHPNRLLFHPVRSIGRGVAASLLPIATTEVVDSAQSVPERASSDSICLIYGQWVQINIASIPFRPRKSWRRTTFPRTTSGGANSGAVVPNRNVVDSV